MNGEPQPPERGDKLDRAVFTLKTVWFGLFSGGLVVAVVMVAIVMSGGGAVVDLGPLAYLFLAAVPLGLVGAYVVAPMVAPKDPGAIARRSLPGRPGGFEGWEGTTPDEAYHWFPAYSSAFFVRAGMLEGAAIVCSLGFFVTANWAVLGGTAVLLAALIAEVPTRAGAESFAEAARRKQGSE